MRANIAIIVTALSAGIFAGYAVADPSVKSPRPAPDAKLSPLAPSETRFELCFAGNHGRCFKTMNAGMFVQYGGASNSEAFLSETDKINLQRNIERFFKTIAYTKASTPKNCAKPFVFRLTKNSAAANGNAETPNGTSSTAATTNKNSVTTESVRCLEKLKKTDSDKLLSLVTEVSLASKPL